MRSVMFVFLTLTALLGCEHKNKTDKTGGPSGGGGNNGPQVRPPTPEDLAEYTKDLPGTGKLMARIETPLGTINCELFADKAPMTVANFVGLATGKKPWNNPNTNQVETNKPYFDGL